jgi:hypothetical protein
MQSVSERTEASGRYFNSKRHLVRSATVQIPGSQPFFDLPYMNDEIVGRLPSRLMYYPLLTQQ